MKTNFASIELHYIVDELQFLVDGKIDNIYNPEKDEFILQMHVPNKGKQILRIVSGKVIYIASSKKPAEEPSGFCMFLRKHLGNARLREVRQIYSERIVEFVFGKEDEQRLIVEFFGKGNVILCDKEHTILSALVYHKWKDREIMARSKYTYPKMNINFMDFKAEEIKELLKKTDKSLVKCLAAELGLGGSYSEEICLISGLDKGSNPNELGDKEIKGIIKSVKGLTDNNVKPSIVYEGDNAKDVVPFSLGIYKGLKEKEFKSYNEAIDYFFINEFKEEKKKTSQEKEIERLKRIVESQLGSISELGSKETKEREKAELIYQNYGLLSNVLEEMKKAKEKYDWKEIKNRLKGHKLIKSVNAKDKTIEVEF
ncbi:MAG: NFACT family protein [Nanoarchaeota archaeon]|nr:NFACT family protein [Nanoarchaeota archaeon]MBU1005680.1 NFACT family protein [Nanoarchaeota archaeon]MBU1945958.1 NFACT family protein [Nanoarchaeota archaeon]